MMSRTPAIVGWSVLSPLGIGRREFAERLRAGERIRRLPPDLDVATLVGPKGTRGLDRMTLMVIATTGMILEEYAEPLRDVAGSIGLVLGTSTGSVASTTAFIRDTFIQERPYFVNPTHFPNTVMNGAAGHTAIWYGLTGLNSTISSGQLTGLAALRYAYRMIRSGYADTLLVGCVEELSAPVAAAAARVRRVHGGPVPGEGCAMFLVSGQDSAGPSGHRVLAEVVDFEFGMSTRPGPDAQADRLATGIRTLLVRNGVGRDELGRVSLAHGGGTELGAAERSAIDSVLGAGPAPVVVGDQIGDSFSAHGAFQLAALLATAEEPARLALVTSLGVDGAVACALVRAGITGRR
ncbi:MAG TPA: beta-ketoacyl synthase N-terminal-like domain-containing protein [Micromonosporaceae bacterium]|jgi:3-oxoacyl-[acyl-carrier-protein] synthase II|nr:beta-ketoacyl synthase N-terminal-like domain-containing protein [Micromonosporaceae bacterium]